MKRKIKYLKKRFSGSPIIFAIAIMVILIPSAVGLISLNKSIHTEHFGNIVVDYFNKKGDIQISVSLNKDIWGFITNAYIGVPYARFKYLGAWGSHENKVEIPVKTWLPKVFLSWKSATNTNMKDQRIALLLFLSFVSKDYYKYDKILSVPIDLTMLSDHKVKISISVDLSKEKPVGFIDINNLPRCTSCHKTQDHIVGENCIDLGCAEGICTCYCVRWVAPDDQYWSSDSYTFNPVLVTKLNYDAYTSKKVTLHMHMSYDNVDYFATIIGGVFGGSEQQKTIGFYHVWSLSQRTLEFEQDTFQFMNSRYYPNNYPTYQDNALIAVGTYGAGAIGNFIKQEKYCECGFCDQVDYHNTDQSAVLIVWDLRVWDIYGSEWYIPTTFDIDNNPYDGQGLTEKYINFLIGQTSLLESDSDVINPPEEYYYYNYEWSYSDASFGFGLSITGLLDAHGINIGVSIDPDFGILPIYAKSYLHNIFSIMINIEFDDQYNNIYLYLYDHKNSEEYLFDDYYYTVPVHFLNTFILS